MPLSGSPATYAKNSLAVFDVRSYGAACDATALGVGTDDTTAIQAAINAAQLVGGTVLIPARCKITSALTVTESVTICGPGAAPDSIGSTGSAPTPFGTTYSLGAIGYIPVGQIIKTHTNGDAITVTGDNANIGVHIHDLGVTCATDGQYHTAGAGIRLSSTIGSTIERVVVFHHYDGVVVDGNGWMTRIRDCQVSCQKRDGIRRVGGTNYHSLKISGCQVSNGGPPGAHYWGSGSGIYLENCCPVVHDCDVVGWAKGMYVGAGAQYGFFANNWSDTCTLPWHFNTSTCIAHQVTGCEAYMAVGGTAVSITGATNLSWVGGNIFGGSASSSDSGFAIDSSAQDVNISQVRFHASGVTGPLGVFPGAPLRAASGAHDFQFCDNRAPRGSGAITLGGSHTYGFIKDNTGMANISGSTTGTGNSMANGPY